MVSRGARLRLVPAGPDEQAPPLPVSLDPTIQLWTDHAGAVFSYGRRLDHFYWLQLPDVASYRFAADDPTILAIPHGEPRWELIRDHFTRHVMPMALQALGWESLHASGVLGRRGVAALCGQPRAGKSTAAYALRARGYRQWADDSIVLEIADAGISAVPLPFRVRLRSASAVHFALEVTPDLFVGPEMTAPTEAPVRLASICLLDRRSEHDAAKLSVRQLSPTEAFHAVLPHATCFNLHDQGRKRLMVEHYFELTRRVPVYAIRYGNGFERLDELADAIEGLIGGAATGVE